MRRGTAATIIPIFLLVGIFSFLGWKIYEKEQRRAEYAEQQLLHRIEFIKVRDEAARRSSAILHGPPSAVIGDPLEFDSLLKRSNRRSVTDRSLLDTPKSAETCVVCGSKVEPVARFRGLYACTYCGNLQAGGVR